MVRAVLLTALVAAAVAVASALPAENLTASAKVNGPASASVEPSPRMGRIVVRPPVREVEEAASNPVPVGVPAPVPLPVRTNPANLGPGPLPGTISFPSERLQQADDRQDFGQDIYSWKSLYDGCGSTKNCLGIPADCEEQSSCRAIVTVQVLDGVYTFRMRATDALWVAVGLGDTPKMYDTSVIECVNQPIGTISAHMSYTPKSPQRGCVRLGGKADSALNLLSARSMDGGLFCEVTRVNQTRINGKDYFLDQTPYNLQLAYGSNLQGTQGVGYHAENRNSAGVSLMLADYLTLGSASNWPMRLHGALMVIAWIFAATAGSLAARYFKAAWGKATICGKAMWFAWHRLLMGMTVVLHVVAVIAALIFLQGWSSSSGVHGILGGVTTGLALLQGAAGLLRPSPDHKYRPMFNWAHRCQGFLTHCLAIITIFLAVALPYSRLPSYTYAILGVYVAFYVAMHAVHSLTEVQSYYFVVVVFGSAVFASAMLILIVIGPGSSYS